MKRRELFRVLGASLGGATLAASCGDDGPTGPTETPFPNAYRFYPVKSTGDSLPGGGSLESFRLDVTIDPIGELLYGVVDGNDLPGLYGMALDFSGSGAPRLVAERRLAREGDVLPDGNKIQELHNYDVNEHGSCAIVLKVDSEYMVPGGNHYGTEIVYRGTQESALEKVLFDGFVTRDGHILSGRFGDIDTHSGHDMLFVARYYHQHDATPGNPDDAHGSRGLEGIFLAPDGNIPETRLVLNSEDLVSGDDLVGGFGLVDLHDGGNFVAQVHPGRLHDTSPNLRADAGPPEQGAVIFHGNVSTRRAAAASSLRSTSRSALLGQAVGFSTYGPRIGSGDRTAFVLHTSANSMALYYHGLRVVETGERSSSGNLVTNITPPAFGPGGEIYYVLVTNAGHELHVGNGDTSALLLRSGDRLADDPRTVAMIALGHTTEHVDHEGRVALVTTFTDGSAALVVGLPV